MSAPRARVIELCHEIPGRLRLRLDWLRAHPELAEPLADRLAALDESIEVRVRAWTGSVLCEYDPERLDVDSIVAAVRRHTRATKLRRPGERPPPETPARAPGDVRVRGAVNEAFHGMNRGVLRVTDGRLDLGALTGLAFLAAGALEIAVTRRVPAPPWFNLAWMAFRTFQLSGAPEDMEEEVAPDEAAADTLGAAPGLAEASPEDGPPLPSGSV
jgi:hypothetical protein